LLVRPEKVVISLLDDGKTSSSAVFTEAERIERLLNFLESDHEPYHGTFHPQFQIVLYRGIEPYKTYMAQLIPESSVLVAENGEVNYHRFGRAFRGLLVEFLFCNPAELRVVGAKETSNVIPLSPKGAREPKPPA